MLGGLLLAISGILLLVALNSGWFSRNPEEAPIIYRPPVDPLARDFVYFFAIGPALMGSLISGLFDLDRVAGGAGVALLMSGLAAIVATGDLVQLRRQRLLRSVWAAAIIAPALVALATTIFLPWTGSGEVATSLPARAIANFFGDSFERRTNQRLRAVAGDPQLAALISLDAARPHLLLDATPERTPWLNLAKFNETGGVVVWRAIRHHRHAAGRYRAAISRPGAGSAAGVRVARHRAAAAVADRLGHRAAEDAVATFELAVAAHSKLGHSHDYVCLNFGSNFAASVSVRDLRRGVVGCCLQPSLHLLLRSRCVVGFPDSMQQQDGGARMRGSDPL